MGADALGFMCVPESPRFIDPVAIRAIAQTLPPLNPFGLPLATIGVFADAPLARIIETVEMAQLTGIQLHGRETPDFCEAIRNALPDIELIKAIRVKDADALAEAQRYALIVDALLLDAFAPHALGGTGAVWDWSLLHQCRLERFWFLAGGLNPFNVEKALQQVHPPGIDVSSGVERSPGDKDLDLVQQLLQQCSKETPHSSVGSA